MSETMNLAFHEGYIEVTAKEGAVTQQKLIDYGQVRSLFQEEAPAVDTGWLPGEYGVQRMVIRNGMRYILYLEPARVVDVHHQGRRNADEEVRRDEFGSQEEYEQAVEAFNREHRGETSRSYKFPVPALCWMVRTDARNSNRRKKIKVYAMKSPIILGMERLYLAPFSNIYDRNDVCWGENEVNLPTPKAIQGLSTLFFGADANMDLSQGRFDSYERKYYPGEAFRPIHFHMDMDRMLQDPEETPESALAFVHSKLLDTGTTVERGFESFMRD